MLAFNYSFKLDWPHREWNPSIFTQAMSHKFLNSLNVNDDYDASIAYSYHVLFQSI